MKYIVEWVTSTIYQAEVEADSEEDVTTMLEDEGYLEGAEIIGDFGDARIKNIKEVK